MRTLRLVHSSRRFEHSDRGSSTAHGAAEADCRPPPEPVRREINPELRALDPAVQAIVKQVRIVAPLPHLVRARALARARAASAAPIVS